jgi:UDPglucose 6-dehydrogenase
MTGTPEINITVYGVGYVGLVTAACLADTGYRVLGIDIDPRKIDILNRGETFFYENGLEPILQRNIAAGRLQFSTDPAKGVAFGKIQFITVGTPPHPDGNGAVDLSYVMSVAHTIGENMQDEKLVVIKSTVPVGTCDAVRANIATAVKARNATIPFDVAFNPEFLKEGAAVEDFCKPDRIILGCESTAAVETLKHIYAPFNRNHDRTIVMDIRSAELTKYAANAMLATKISLMNEIANIASHVGADIEHVRHGIGSDPRIGRHFIYPGCGYGGSCFPKDVQALINLSSKAGYEAVLLKSVETVNSRQKRVLFQKITRHFGGAKNIAGKTFAIWGLAFKPHTDDIREASSIVLMEALMEAGAHIAAYDPKAMDAINQMFSGNEKMQLKNSKEACLEGADALVVCTEWPEFWVLDTDLLAEKLRSKVIFDGRNLYDPDALSELGFSYYGIGRGLGDNN